MKFLRQSTATTIVLGPLVDSADASAETALTISQADVLLWKEGGTTLAQKNDATAATHRSNGLYTCPLNATDTNTLGQLIVNVAETGTLVFRDDYMVVPANVYDSLVLGTDTLQADVTQFNGTAGTFASGRPEVNTTHLGGSAVSATSGLINANVTQISGDSVAADNLESYCDGTTPQPVNVTQVSGDSAAADNLESYCDGTTPAPVNATQLSGSSANLLNLNASASTIVRGTVDTGAFSPTTTQFEADDITEATASHYVGRRVIFTSGSLSGQAALITAYSLQGANGRFTVTTMTEAPANNDTFVLV